MNLRLFGAEIDGGDSYAVVHSCAQLVGVLQQHQIELAAIDVVGVVPVDAGLLALFKADIDVAVGRQAVEAVNIGNFVVVGGPDSAELVRELRRFHLREKIEILEHAGR